MIIGCGYRNQVRELWNQSQVSETEARVEKKNLRFQSSQAIFRSC